MLELNIFMSWLVKLVREGVNLDLIWRQKQPLLVHYKVGKQNSFVFIHTLFIMEVVCKQKICWGCFYSLHLEFLFKVCNTGWSKIFNQIWIVFPNALYICMNIEIHIMLSWDYSVGVRGNPEKIQIFEIPHTNTNI